MIREDETKLLDYLESKGFAGEKFQADVRQNISLNLPAFSVLFRQKYGNNQMSFELYFQMDPQFDNYRLESYAATYRAPVYIDHKVINGVSTMLLEEQMELHDWEKWFSTQQKITEPATIASVREIFSAFNKLSEGQDPAGMKILEELMYKYFPAEIYSQYGWKGDLKEFYENTQEFLPGTEGISSAHLAYYITSRKIDNLYELLQPLNLEQYLGFDLYGFLEQKLSTNPEKFEIKCARNEQEGYVEFVMPIYLENDFYKADGYTTKMTLYPPIRHGHFNGIDTEELEKAMQKIDWNDEKQLYTLQDGKLEIKKSVYVVKELLKSLSQDMSSVEVSCALQAKFWMGSKVPDHFINQPMRDYLARLPKREEHFIIETDVKAAYNLLCGRAVKDDLMYPFLEKSDDWTRLDISQIDASGGYRTDNIFDFSEKELSEYIRLLPTISPGPEEIKNGLIAGDLVTAQLSNHTVVILEACPEKKGIQIYSQDMEPIPFNIHFEPGWEVERGKKVKQKDRIVRQLKLHKANNKGRGL